MDEAGEGLAGGEVAIKGDPADPGAAGDLGREVSSGCIRLDNGAISHLARILPLGAPVTVRK
jgi:lipoprotein-anchoring transpeptidase ErfK/SrfK